jgi:hypothetical protein
MSHDIWQAPILTLAETHPTYKEYSHLLTDGWIPGRKVVGRPMPWVRVCVLTVSGQHR